MVAPPQLDRQPGAQMAQANAWRQWLVTDAPDTLRKELTAASWLSVERTLVHLLKNHFIFLRQ
jgi:hypothetical protein